MKTMKNRYYLIILIPLISLSCIHNDVYLKYKSITTRGWNKDSLYCFDVPIKDTTAFYNVYINIRNRGEYPYQNLWFFLSKTTPDSIQTKDSIECYLADNHGKWLGTGIGSVLQMAVLYKQHVRFNKAGIYHYSINHGMRDSVLVGINDIGMQVEKVSKQ